MKQLKRFSMMLLACMLMVCTASADELVAFPGAQGFGRLATGGRGGTVYHVTNLKDSGTGSFRDAISQPNRIIVFDVSGVIKISGRLVFKSNQTIAGQTAPGEGITIYGDGMSCSGATNVIMRYVRFRMGVNGTKDGDCAGLANGGNMIFDHCSFAWGQDENFSINWDNKGTAPHDVTLQNCIVGQGLMVHSAGGLIQADNITMYRTLLCDNKTRNFKVKGKHQYCNNIVYNWSTYAYEMGGESSGESYANAVGNLFINGNSTSTSANGFSGGNSGFHFYGADNWQDRNKDGVFNPTEFTGDGGGDRQSTPYNYPELELYAGNTLIDNLLPDVGATLPYRDLTDAYMVNEVLSFGLKGNLITSEKDLPYGTPDTWTVFAGTKKTDSDGDGMPDAWETANGTNPNSDDAMVIAANGYANIENYINGITKADRDYFLRAPYNVTLEDRTTTTLTIGWSDFSDNETGFAVELQNGNTWSEVGRTAANVMTYTIEGLQQATKYNVRVRAVGSNGGETFSDYTTGSFSTRQEQQGIIDIDTFEPDVTLGDNQTAWDYNTTEWKEQKSFKDNDNVLLATNTDKTLAISGDVQPGAVVVKGTGNLTISGAVMGSGSMNKAGTGTLVLDNNNTYKGATVLHEGTIEIGKLANGGEASSLGSSVADAQNWVFDGGTYKYTGGDVATDRSAQLLSPTTLSIAQSGKKITMNGSFEGAGDLIVDGAGLLLINNAAAFKNTGSLILKGGEVRLGSKAVSDAGIGTSSKLVLQGGTFTTVGKNEANVTYNFPIEVAEGNASTVDFDLWNSNKCKVTGSGTLIWNVHYLREYIEGNWDGFTGKLIINGTGKAKESQFAIKNNGVKNATIELKGTASITGGKNAETNYLGGLSGESSTALSGFNVKQNGNGTWVVGGANTDETFKGIIDDYAQDHSHKGKTAITKAGTGYWRLTGNNTYSGATAVNAGTLIVNGKHSGTGAITVAAAGTLAGKGTLAGATTVNGTLMVGDDGASDKGLTFSGTLKLGSAAKLKLNDAMAAKKYSTSSTVQAFTGSVSSGTFAEIIPATPGEGLSWDTSALYTSGVLKVKSGGTDPGTDPDPVSAELSFGGQTTSSAVMGEAYTAPTLTNPYKVDVTYSSSNTSVATVNNEGAVTLVGAGETTITASFAGNASYLAGSASYKLTVTEPEPQPQGTQQVCIAWGNCIRTGGDSSCTELVGNEASPSNNIGFSMHYTTVTDKYYTKGDKMTYDFDGVQRTGIALSNGAQNSIVIPAGYKVTKVTFWSVTGTNTSDRVSYWKEVAGQTYTEADGQIMSHTATASAPNKAVFNLNNVQNELTFTNTGEQQKVIIVLEYHVGEDPEPVSADLSYGSSEADNVVLGEAYTARTLTNPHNVSVTYSSSNTSVATVNQQGAVTIVGAGETKITATFAGNDEYLAGSASYDIVVTMPVGINNVNADADADEVFYNTSGQKVGKNTPGILIKDGKKYSK
ncbi:MAG: autotransporter-associated beta strand repeat-containing protein [Prevotella sp.]|nr:autotransporter-associated beta strand repeat-containing protein [Prevotella sp.]